MDTTPNLGLPYIMAAQSQKHVTHNEAIRALDALVQLTVEDRDLGSPPPAPVDGARYIVAASAAGAWSSHAGEIAAFQDGAWSFLTPREGWVAWIADESELVVFGETGWTSDWQRTPTLNPVPFVGVNATADADNRLAVKSGATLLDNAGAGHQLKINKAAAADTAALLLQSGYAGRAEIGLAGDDNLHVKVSADGAAWREAIVVDRATGAVSFPNTTIGSGGTGGPGANIWIDASAAPHNAAGDGTTDDAPRIQSALDAAGAAGGGTVWVPAGTYRIDTPIAVPARVELVGSGWNTIIRPIAGTLPNKTVNGVGYSAAVIMGYSDSAVRNLFLDLRTNASRTNGIQIGEHGAASRASDCEITGCRVHGWATHQYLLYVKKADRCRLVGNTIRGLPAGSTTEDCCGIEVFGSSATEVASNNIANCGPGITVKTQADVPDSYLLNVSVHDCVVDTCHNGIVVSVTSGTGNASSNLTVRNCIVTNMTNRGCSLEFEWVPPRATLALSGNTLREAANGCLVIDGDASATADALLIDGNTVIQAGGTSAGIYVKGVTAALIVSNQVIGTPAYNVSIFAANDAKLLSNALLGSQLEGVYIAGGSQRTVIGGNTIAGYGATTSKTGIKADAGTAAHVIMSNYFQPHATSAGAYIIDCQAATNCCITDDNVPSATTQSAVYVNGTGGRNGYGIAGWDRNAYRVTKIFPREVGVHLSNTDILTDALDIGSSKLRLRSPETPASAAASGSQGQIRWDANYVYVCVAANSWKRVALAAW